MDDNVQVEDPFHLRPLWDALMEIYLEYAKICERHNLRYYACAGTVLGALRHKGFIPWDDDFDVIMPRPDYEKFLEIASAELPEHLKIVNRQNTPEFNLLFSKVQECRREKIEAIEKGVGHILSNGIFVDVFPLDGYPESFFARLYGSIFEKLWFFYNYHVTFAQRHLPLTLKRIMTRIIGILLSPFFGFKNRNQMLDVAEAHLRRFPFSNEKWSGAGGCVIGRFERVVPPCIWGNPRSVPFDRIFVRVPEKAEDLMRNIYGDYMKLPPIEKRRSTHNAANHQAWWLGPTNTNSK